MHDMVLPRLVERRRLEARNPPDFRFTSGRPNRYNPAGIEGVYFAADAATAGAEFDRAWEGRPTQWILYFCRVSTALVLDLTDTACREKLGLSEEELFADWRFSQTPTTTQELGACVASQTHFAGIRYPSDAARERGFTGANLVFFRAATVAPARLEIFDDTGCLLQTWP